ncbi:MAG: hypothetical protein ACLRRT_07410 [Ruthenibacterium lactatiformans]
MFRQEETLAACDAFSILQNTVLAKRDVVLDETFVPCEQAVTATTGQPPDPRQKLSPPWLPPCRRRCWKRTAVLRCAGAPWQHLF